MQLRTQPGEQAQRKMLAVCDRYQTQVEERHSREEGRTGVVHTGLEERMEETWSVVWSKGQVIVGDRDVC